ncbi:MAG: T9SS type A sorting domain-containing protein, partial [Candidatus Neomarinimicrobiota bacterium]
DEAATPILAAKSPASSTDKYFRFGDGGGDTYGAVYDWFIWDTTGAYAPGEGPELPENILTVTGTGTGVTLKIIDTEQLPETFELSQNYPNPFNPTTQIHFKIAKATDVRLVVYDLTGRLVTTLVHDMKQPGSYRVQWNGRDNLGRLLPSGVYFYLLEAGDYRATKKMLLLK